jgi:alpha-L-fucosidase
MKRFCSCALVILCCSIASAKIIAVPSGSTTRPLAVESKEALDARMAWWRDARFGMFIHFGLYAIPAGEWNGVKTKGAGEWIQNDLKIPANDYAPLRGKFNPVNFDAAKWADIAKTAGMKYVVITSKHHEGFSLFDSKFSDFDVMTTPFKRDIMKELSTAVRDAGLKIGWYYSIMDWHDPDAQKEETFGKYEWRMRGQIGELLSNYGDIGVMWFDGEWTKPWNDERGKDLYTLCRSLQPNVIVNNRVGKQRAGMNGFTRTGGFAGDYATPEQQIPKTVPPGLDWETCMTMNGTWGFKTEDLNWKTPTTLIRQLIEIASKGGNFLLNVGPTAQGEIPQASIERLQAIGKWMDVNGEAIHGTTASPFAGKLPFGYATQKPGKLYLHVIDWPADQMITVPITNAAKKATILGQAVAPLDIETTPAGVVVHVPPSMPNRDATVIALEIEGPPQLIAPPTTASTSPPATTQTATTQPAKKN